MSYQGYHVKIGNYTVPYKYMIASSYKSCLHGQDLDSFVDGDGYTKRNALKVLKPKVEWNTGKTNNVEIAPLLQALKDNYVDKTEKKVSATVYIEEIDDYITTDAYVPDIEFTTEWIDEAESIIYYEGIRIAIISTGIEV